MYKVEYQYEDEEKPHNRFYSALDVSTAKAMFEETCEQSLDGAKIKIVDVCKIEAYASESSYAKFCAEDDKSKY
jgi:hypothetical protein